MRDTELYAKMLGLEKPWFVERVELSMGQREVHVWVSHGEEKWKCPECEEGCGLYDHEQERVWRHLDTMQYTTMLHGRPPRIECSEHGVRQVRLPWAEPKSRFTALFERFAIEVLQQGGTAAGRKILRLSWDQAWEIQERAVKRGLQRKGKKVPEYVGIDEKAFAKGHSYMTMVSDLKKPSVEWVADERTSDSLAEYFKQFTEAELGEIKAIGMDMWKAYAKAVREYVPYADRKIVYDRFHVMQELGEAVDQVRKREHRSLLGSGDDRLKGTKYFWLYSREKLPRKHRREFAALKRAGLKTARAWAIKEHLRHLWTLTTPAGAIRFWKAWYFWASHSRLEPIKAAARKLYRHAAEIINYFHHRITNAQAEALNGRIERIKRIAHGFRNRSNFKTSILFHLGSLDMLPATHGKP